MKEKLWLGPGDHDFYGFHGPTHAGAPAAYYYNYNLDYRMEKYPYTLDSGSLETMNNVRSRGYHKIEDFFDDDQKAVLTSVGKTISTYVEEDKNILRRDEAMAFVEQPLVNIPGLFDILFDDGIINLAAAHFGCIPALTSIAARKSFLHDSEPYDNQLFHRDFNSLVKVIKFGIYLNDVDENGGPLGYIEGSNYNMFTKWWRYHYLPDDWLVKFYGEDKLKKLTANFGDLLIADTKGFHKGNKPVNKERLAVHACFLIHPEMAGTDQRQELPLEKRMQIKKEDFDNLPDWKKPVADFLYKV